MWHNVHNKNLRYCPLPQGLLRLGTICWVLYPGHGQKPVAEGIAGSAPPAVDTESGNERSYLMSLCEAGQQYVTITRVHKKNVELMFMHGSPEIRNLDDVLVAPALCDRMVRWSVRYLVDKLKVTQP